jgi:hypothetical protein
MSLPRRIWGRLGGFDPGLDSAEDQDLALRHARQGGSLGYVPEAVAIHRDHAVRIRSYCRRAEWGAETTVAFCHKYPSLPDNVERERVNGPVRWGEEPLATSLKKLSKQFLGLAPMRSGLFVLALALEGAAPESRLLWRIYEVLLGVHILRGYRSGLRRYGPVPTATPIRA